MAKNEEKNARQKSLKKGKILKKGAIVVSAVAGCVNGLFGGGGGMLIVPILSGYGLDAKKAHATAVAVILPLCLISAIIYVVKGCFELSLAISVGGGVVAGGILGALLLKKADNFWLSMLFYADMIGAGIKMVTG